MEAKAKKRGSKRLKALLSKKGERRVVTLCQEGEKSSARHEGRALDRRLSACRGSMA
jgi:hypothetical protein